jgi:hypothetical protein
MKGLKGIPTLPFVIGWDEPITAGVESQGKFQGSTEYRVLENRAGKMGAKWRGWLFRRLRKDGIKVQRAFRRKYVL